MTVFWQKNPALRVLLPFSAGIFLQDTLSFDLETLVALMAVLFLYTILYQYFGIRRKFFLNRVNGLILQLLIFNAGLLLAVANDRSIQKGIHDFYHPGSPIVATIDEALTEKQNSYKTIATTRLPADSANRAGKAIIYFSKDTSILQLLPPGTSIVFKKNLQEIRNSGNPGSFDYKSHCLRQGITHQVFLKKTDLQLLPGKVSRFPDDLIHNIRGWVINQLRLHIPGKKQQGLAEALLIGYRDDLDKPLVQAYANTGVVHVIAISGLHLGIIYTILVFLTSALNRKGWYWCRFLLILGGLWSFTLIAGAQASVLRSAVMFSFVAAGVVLKRNTSVINSLALSALLLLCWKPQWLWDVGFQLSYTAVLSIVLFFKHVYGWLFLPGKIADSIWKLTAVTISAQFLTLPLTLYYFHQFPLLFVITNLVAVPLSSLVLIGEIVLIAISPFHAPASFAGLVLSELIRWMNVFIESANQLPFNTWKGLQLHQLQVVILYVIIGASAAWLLKKERSFAFAAIISCLLFITCRTFSFAEASTQKKLVVYNIAKMRAADIMIGRRNLFIGDTSVLYDTFALDYHLTPSWRLHRINQQLPLHKENITLSMYGKKVGFASTALPPHSTNVLVISGKLSPAAEPGALQTSLVILDASMPFGNTIAWKKELQKLNIPFHDVKEKGAFVMNF